MNRDILIGFIPTPTNKDVIIYDTSLKDLIDVDVMQEYKDLLPTYNLYCQKYLECKNKIENYEKELNNIYLYKTNWSEEDYLYNLQNDKKTYSILFQSVKKIENNIQVLQKKILMIDDKIQIQKAKEEKEIEEKKANINKKIDENINKLVSYKEICTDLKSDNQQINNKIKENEEDFSILKEIVEDIQNGVCKCRYCGSKLSNVSEDSKFYKKTFKNLENNKKELEKLLEKKKKNEEQISICEKNINDLKEELKNDNNFKSQDLNFYRKKSIEILRLEAQRDLMINEIENLQKELESKNETKSQKFLELKDKIKKCELSLDNLKKIKSMKDDVQKYTLEYNKMKENLIEMKQKLEKYKKFLTIFFKIYEQKASDFCGKDFKFKIFEFDNYNLIEKFEVYYKTIEYKNLSPESKKIVDNVFKEKLIFYD